MDHNDQEHREQPNETERKQRHPACDNVSSHQNRRFHGSIHTSSEPSLLLDTLDTRILDPVTYDNVRAHLPNRNAHGRRRFATTRDQPDVAQWAVFDRHESITLWADEWGRFWEKGSKGPAQRSDMVLVPIWWRRTGSYTDAYIKESARYVLYWTPDGNLRIRQSLREGISASTHYFFGYFPRRGHTDLWFAPMSAPSFSRVFWFNGEIAAPESLIHTRPQSASERDTRHDCIRHAVRQGLDSNRDLGTEDCQLERGRAEPTRPLSEKIKSLLSLIETARLEFRQLVEREVADFKLNVGERDTKRTHPGAGQRLTNIPGSRGSVLSTRDVSVRLRANDTTQLCKHQVLRERTKNGLVDSRNCNELATELHLVQCHVRPSVSVVTDEHAEDEL
ncbi:hypothetical protein CH63R_00569 [Colletotrichum higginsianum IMI 349063]|uniref:Uncharacterized protein n=1 Tax=Colletotrichum higginsianum (strain IMI 349063) TaxID=759273 RepID=A0A1B7YTL4_COLHI|nr:hypothetical protein CH63R_00569 [Colletotrichum higginsianum IMI 349063]OBR15389.1 hypothetical protein CH63R_00569 [Colletotrichum higginsianum IMI 349063]